MHRPTDFAGCAALPSSTSVLYTLAGRKGRGHKGNRISKEPL